MITGACLCGAIRYEVTGPIAQLVHCHCRTCRKHHGAPFATFAVVPRHAVRGFDRETSAREYVTSTGCVRRFCGTCSSVVPSVLGAHAIVPAGNLIGALGMLSELHAFVGSKAPWHVIADELPQHDQAPPGWPLHDALRPVNPHAPEDAIQGSCACGAVKFSVCGNPARWLQCHCSRCRRGRSAAHGSNTFYPTNQFTWRAGRALVRTYVPPDAKRFTLSFCARCGGAAPVERDGVPFVLVAASSLDGSPGGRPEAHIHVASKAPWYVICDELPQYAELPPA